MLDLLADFVAYNRNITVVIDPVGNRTEMVYGAEYSHAYPTLIRKTGSDGQVKDADGNITEDFIQKFAYDLNTGLKTWGIDPLAMVGVSNDVLSWIENQMVQDLTPSITEINKQAIEIIEAKKCIKLI